MCVGHVVLIPNQHMQGYLDLPIMVREDRKPLFNDMTPLLVCGNLSINKNLDDFVWLHMN